MFRRRNNFDGWRNFPFAEPGFLKPGLRPKIGVVIPCFNHGRFLTTAINSTREAASNYDLEIIVVNDGSTDDTITVLQKTDFPGLKKYTREHSGLAEALNFGFGQTIAEFVTWTSADNLYRPGALDRMANFLIANPAVAMTYANVQLINDDGAIYNYSDYRRDNQRKSDSSILDLPCEISALSAYSDNFINACFLLRRSICLRVGSYDPAKLGFEDYDYWLRVAAIGKIAHIDTEEPLYRYRLHDNTLTAKLSADSLQQSQLTMLRKEPRSKAAPAETPLDSIPEILRRARDADYGAVTLGKGEKFAALLIYRSWSIEEGFRMESELPELMDAVPECRFVILNWSGNKIEDNLRSKLESRSNFLLLDFSNESDALEVFSSGNPNRWSSLTCAISSCGVLLETVIGGDSSSEARALTTLQLGALTRRNVFFFHTQATSCAELREAPHAILPDISAYGRRKKLRESIITAISDRPPIGSCEQFLKL
jgi:hypothetical protein